MFSSSRLLVGKSLRQQTAPNTRVNLSVRLSRPLRAQRPHQFARRLRATFGSTKDVGYQEMLTHTSIAAISEASLIDLLIRDRHWRSRVLGIQGIHSDSTPFQSVPLSGLPGKPRGDVDILLVVPGRPDLATAIQVKRIKAGAAAIRTGRPNKLYELKKGVRQANVLARIGFLQVYLYVFVVVDGREQNAGRISYDGLSPELRSLIGQVISPSGLDQRAGLIHYEFVQPMDDEPLGIGTYGGHLVRLAESMAQPPEVTTWVAQLTTAGAA